MKPLARTLLLLPLFLLACSGDDEDESNPSPTPLEQKYAAYPFSRLEMSEEIITDAQPVTSTQTYLYDNDGLLHTRIGKQEISVGGELLWETADTTTLAYRGDQAVVTEETGTTLTYTLNLQGYATSCIRQEAAGNLRRYELDYDHDTEGNFRLKSLTERIDGTPFSSLTIDYADPRCLRVTQQVESVVQRFTLTTDPDCEIENRAHIPCLFLADIYPLSLHNAALYAKLLGEHTAYLVSQVTPDSDGTSEETTTYSYSLSALGIVTACQETIRHQEADGISRSYRRTVCYDIR